MTINKTWWLSKCSKFNVFNFFINFVLQKIKTCYFNNHFCFKEKLLWYVFLIYNEAQNLCWVISDVMLWKTLLISMTFLLFWMGVSGLCAQAAKFPLIFFSTYVRDGILLPVKVFLYFTFRNLIFAENQLKNYWICYFYWWKYSSESIRKTKNLFTQMLCS